MMTPRLQQLYAFLKDSPTDSFILFAIAKEYEKMGDKEKALGYYVGLKDLDPDYVGTYYHLGKLYESNEDFKTAFFTYKEGMAVAKKMGDQHAFNELAGAKLGVGDEEDFED